VQLQQYNPDAICRALGLPGFHEPWQRGKPTRTLRLLLTPSFSPECCFDLFEEAGQTIVEFRVARTHIWHLAEAGLVAVDRYRLILVVGMEDIEISFRAAFVKPAEKVVMVDGMPVHGVLRSVSASISISDNPAKGTPLADFLAGFLKQAFAACDDVRGRNAIATIASYVALTLPQEAETARPAITTISVLGEAAEQEALLGALEAVERRRLERPVK